MAQKHSVQIDRDAEKFTTHAITYRLIAHQCGVAVPTYASPIEVMRAILAACPQGQDITFPKAPRSNGRYEGDKGTRYHGPSKHTLNKRKGSALRA